MSKDTPNTPSSPAEPVTGCRDDADREYERASRVRPGIPGLDGRCDKCGGENDIADWSSYCSACRDDYQARIRLDPETQPVGTPAVKCGSCSQPATRRDADDVADVCDYCGEASDDQKREGEKRRRRMAEREEI